MFKSISEVTIPILQKHATVIHYFGLGFIQIKLGTIYRMHFYSPKLPPTIDEEDVHNHRYDFKSSILSGVLHQELFVTTADATHIIEAESCKEGMLANVAPLQCGIKKVVSQSLIAGSVYELPHSTFHRVSAKGCVTLVERGVVVKEFAEVIRLAGTIKVCPVNQKVPRCQLWDIVGNMLAETHAAD